MVIMLQDSRLSQQVDMMVVLMNMFIIGFQQKLKDINLIIFTCIITMHTFIMGLRTETNTILSVV